jgi:hypothetical protein
LLDFAEIPLDPELLPDQGNQYVDADGGPGLCLDSVRRRAVESLDSQVLFDPLEEKFDLPATLVELRDGQRRQVEVVRQKDQSAVAVLVAVADIAQFMRVAL